MLVVEPLLTLLSDSAFPPEYWETETVCPSFPNLSGYEFFVKEHFTDAPDIQEAAWPSGWGVGLEIWRFRVRTPL